jgi:hypothetical protein
VVISQKRINLRCTTGCRLLICPDQRQFFQNAARIRLGTAFRVRDMCATRMFVREFRRAVAGWAATFPTPFCQSFPQLLSAHCLHTCRRTTSRNSQSDGLGWLMPDQQYRSMTGPCFLQKPTVYKWKAKRNVGQKFGWPANAIGCQRGSPAH